MEAVAHGFCSEDHLGLSIGILPAGRPPELYPNRWVEVAIRTHLRGDDPAGPGSRNPINMLTSDLLVAFAGGAGTRAELELAGRRTPPCPLVVYLPGGETIGGLSGPLVAAGGIAVVTELEEVRRFLARELAAARSAPHRQFADGADPQGAK
jgi:hypothetical protein